MEKEEQTWCKTPMMVTDGEVRDRPLQRKLEEGEMCVKIRQSRVGGKECFHYNKGSEK